jgi:copper chaperone CopZ
MVIVMIGLMVAFGLMVGGAGPMAMALPGGGGQGLGMWGVILIPLLGLLIMGTMMYISFRWMAGRRGPMSGMMGYRPGALAQSQMTEGTTFTYSIPAVNCAHCKMTIERELSKLPGVESVSVDIESKQAVVQLVSLPSEEEIARLLTDIGYPPEVQ